MAIRLRLRLPSGQVQLTTEAGVTAAALRALIEQKSAIPAARQQLLVGFPPTRMSDAHCCVDGETVIVRDEAPEPAPSAPDATPPSALIVAPPVAADPPRPGSDGVAVRKVIAADNNCLFAALIHVLQLPDGPQALREAVARCVLDDPATFTAGILGMEPRVYCEWIVARDKHWGGEIELQILSGHLKTQIVVFDIVSLQLFRYGEARGFAELVCLLFDGIHYDAIVVLPAQGAPDEFATSVFGAEDAHVLALARRLQAEAHGARQFTDTAKFTLRCLVCQAGIVGERGAQEHAKATGHTNFAEF
ncbi:hypothetical protein KFE25_008553 [Diacronema lutheri]|uniref:Ubiquitin thioesterase OTU n=2 Tax=Diacronema lutheri TaxID=2081491 RepID=A0A8J5XX54_DIALT|nr:hypothetical protein KFE25_008553 [Diacronema lutheri]